MIHMETVRLTASQALVRFLENQYISYIDMDGNEQEHKFVKGIFMLPGHGNVVGFANGVEQELKDMIVYQGKNEQGMALAAVGYAKQMRRKSIFACTSSVGPGACNMVTAAATATANNIPVLILPGDIYASRQPDPVLHVPEGHRPGHGRGGHSVQLPQRRGGQPPHGPLGLSEEPVQRGL